MLRSLDGAAVRRWAVTCCDQLAAHRDEIDGLNVFPVADQDTGSNLLATMRAGLDAVLREDGADRDARPGSTAARLARGALLGARGNSGVILSQVLRGLAEALGDAATFSGTALREGLRRADALATAAVSDPVPGTVLTVLHAAAHAAEQTQSDDLVDVASAAAAAAAGALADTPRQLAVLARAGVVDAGGQGLVLLLEALLAVVTERCGLAPLGGTLGRAQFPALTPSRPAHTLVGPREAGSTEYEYEVMYLLEGADESRIAALRAELATVGDCVVVVGSGACAGSAAGPDEAEALWKVHVHCTDIGAAIEAGVRAGRPHRITVLRFTEHPDTPRQQDRFVNSHAVIAMVSGAGLVALLRGEGAVVVPATCTAAELLAALAGTRARHVTVLSGPAVVAGVAESAAAQARDTDQEVVVVPTASPVQALAAVAVHDSARHPADDVVAMVEAAAATRRGELTVATEEALTWVGRCQPGDILGLVDDEVMLIGHDLLTVACGLVDRMLSAGGELVTVLLGQRAPRELGAELAEHLRGRHPEVEAVVYDGGQPGSPVLLGVE